MQKEKNKIRNHEFELNSYVVDSLLDVIREMLKANKGEENAKRKYTIKLYFNQIN